MLFTYWFITKITDNDLKWPMSAIFLNFFCPFERCMCISIKLFSSFSENNGVSDWFTRGNFWNQIFITVFYIIWKKMKISLWNWWRKKLRITNLYIYIDKRQKVDFLFWLCSSGCQEAIVFWRRNYLKKSW